MADEEAVITQGDEIVGQVKGPGVHYLNPALQKAHIIKKYLIREYKFSCQPKNNFEVLVFWNVSDSKKYFLFSRSKSVEEINKEIKAKVIDVVEGIDIEYAIKIAANQKDNPQYVDEEFNTILSKIKKALEPFGINIELVNIVTGIDAKS